MLNPMHTDRPTRDCCTTAGQQSGRQPLHARAACALWLLLLPCGGLCAERMLVTVGDTPDSWRYAAAEIEALGGKVLAVHPPQVVLAELDPAVAAHLLDAGWAASITEDAATSGAGYSMSARAGVAYWNRTKGASGPNEEPGDRSQAGEDAVQACPVPPDQERATSALERPTSAFLAGTIVVGAVLPESNGNLDANVEDWTAQEVEQVHQSIITALGRLRDNCPIAGIVPIFHFDEAPPAGGVHGTIGCDYEAVEHRITAVPNALSRLTYDGSPLPLAYAEHLRRLYDADWAFFFVVIDNITSGGGGGASALLGGPFATCFASNDPSVFQHEAGHIFNAPDEYASLHHSPTGRWGYALVVNANSQHNDGSGHNDGAGEGQFALMLNNFNQPSPYSAGQFGWYDSDGDGIIDVSDTFPSVDLELQSVLAGAATFSGRAAVRAAIDQRGGWACDVSINRIVAVQWRLAGGYPWQPVAPADGAYGGAVEDLWFELPPLPAGAYELEARAVDNRGNSTAAPQRTRFEIGGGGVADAAPFAVLAVHPPRQRVGFDVLLDARDSRDLETPAADLLARWDFNGDGAWDTPHSSDLQARHHFAQPGLYQAILEITDAAAHTAQAGAEVLITADNLSPNAALALSAASVHGALAPTYGFDARASYDPEGGSLTVRWDFDGDGQYDTPPSADLTATHTYALSPLNGGLSQRWNVAAELRDADGGSTVITRHLWSCPYDHPPRIAGGVRPTQASPDIQVIFDMNESTDEDLDATWDGLLEFRYDWDGDGNWDTPFAAEPVKLHRYESSGEYRTRVQVRDRFCALDETAFAVHVSSDPVQQPFITIAGAVTPQTIRLAPGAGAQFEAEWEFVGTPGDLSATWLVDGVAGGGAEAGTITAGGLYMAGTDLGEHEVTAISRSNPALRPTATVTVEVDFIEIEPAEFELIEGQTVQLQAITGHPQDAPIEWSINGIAGGHALLATIDDHGLLAAPDVLFGERAIFVQARLAELPDVTAVAAGMLRSTQQPEAEFDASVTQGPAPLTVDFLARPTQPVDYWSWDFDDGTAAAAGPAITHVFQEPGLYTVTLSVRGPGGADREAKPALIRADGGSAPLVDFKAGTTTLIPCQSAPCTVPAFFPIVAGAADSFLWDLGGVRTDSHAVATWPDPPEGRHAIALTVSGPGGTTTKNKPGFFEFRPGPPVDFLVSGPTSGMGLLLVEFVALPQEVPCSYHWLFGDGDSSSDPNPTHAYFRPGTHTVTLTVVSGDLNDGDPCGTPSHLRIGRATREDLIEVIATPPCAVNADCDDRDPCTFDQCVVSTCAHGPKTYGDINEDGHIDRLDADCLVHGFAGSRKCPLNQLDISPCTGDGVVDLNDLIALLDVLAGGAGCTCASEE